MDPVGFSASIVTLCNLTGKIVKYANDVLKASGEQRQIITEVERLTPSLVELKSRIETSNDNDAWTQQVRYLAVEDGPISALTETLSTIAAKIVESDEKPKRSAFKWHWTKQEIQQAIQRTERLKGLITLALASDLTSLSDAIHQDQQLIKADIAELISGTKDIQSSLQKNELQKLAEWLLTPDPSINYHNALKGRHDGTGLWLLESSKYMHWKSEASFMWIHGIPGCGKSILRSATVVENMLQSDAVIAYFYFDFNDVQKQSWTNTMRSILLQLAEQIPQTGKELFQLYQQRQHSRPQPSEEALNSILNECLTKTKHPVYVIVDTVDECTDREEVMSQLRMFLSKSQVHFLVTSRREADIEENLGKLADHSIDVEQAAIANDIERYIEHRLAGVPKLHSIQSEIKDTLLQKVDGMFRWVKLQLDAIVRCSSLGSVRTTLRTLPRNLNETYGRLLKNIEQYHSLDDAIWLLQWLCFSKRPLLLSELAEVHAIQVGQEGGFDPERALFDPTEVLRICSSFVVRSDEEVAACRDEADCEIRLSHFSVKEYLVSDHCVFRESFQEEIASPKIGEACLHYLSFLACKTEIISETLDGYPLASYATLSWWKHAPESDESILLDLAQELTESPRKLYLWTGLLPVFRDQALGLHLNLEGSFDHLDPPLTYIAMTGWCALAKRVLVKCSNIDAVNEDTETALQIATRSGQIKMVELFLESGANPNTYGDDSYPPLLEATAAYRLDIVKVLLKHHADPNLVTTRPISPLIHAATDGNFNILRTLIESGADPNLRFARETALIAAAKNGRVDIVQYLLNNGATIETRGNLLTPLQAATMSGSLQTMQLILDAYPDVNIIGLDGNVPLTAAVQRGFVDAARLLLDYGADSNSLGSDGQSQLSRAAQLGNESMVRLLIQHNADGRSFGPSGMELHEAVEKDDHALLHTILSGKESLQSDLDLAFRAAITFGSIHSAELLLAEGADVHTLGASNVTAITTVAEHGNIEMLQVLLSHGAISTGKCDGRSTSALARAAAVGRESIVQLLLSYGASISEFDELLDGTPVEAAFENDHLSLGTILLEHDD